MESKSYAICEVEFEEGTQYSILCSSWLIRPAKNDGTAQTYCLWPCKKELSSVLAKYRCVPDEDFWIRYKCRVIIEYNEYETATIILDKLKASSNNTSTPVATEATTVPRNLMETIEDSSDTDLSWESELIDDIEFHSLQYDTTCSTSDDVSDSESVSCDDDQRCNDSLYKFPLQTPSDVAELEKTLNASESNDLIIKIRLLDCGSKKLCQTVTSVLQTIFSDECALHCTFYGNNNSKIVFNKLTICSIIIDSALSFHKDKTKDDVIHVIHKWLILAPIRFRNAEKFRKLDEKSKK